MYETEMRKYLIVNHQKILRNLNNTDGNVSNCSCKLKHKFYNS